MGRAEHAVLASQGVTAYGNDLLMHTWGWLSEVDPKGRILWHIYRWGGYGNAREILGLVRLGFTEDRPTDLDLASLPYLIKNLRSPNEFERGWSARTLGELGPRSLSAAPALIDALGDPRDHRLAMSAAEALQKMGPAVLPQLLKALKREEPGVRMYAVSCLQAFKTEHKVIMPALRGMVKDQDPIVRSWAGTAIKIIDPDPREVIQTLMSLLADPVPRVRAQAAFSLRDLGDAAKPALPALIACLKDKDLEVRGSAVASLGWLGLGGPRVVTALLEVMRSKDKDSWHLRSNAAWALGKFGPEAKAAVPLLVEMLTTKDVPTEEVAMMHFRSAAAAALSRMGPAAKPAIKPLMALAQPRRARMTSLGLTAIASLGAIGPEAKEAVPLLREIARDELYQPAASIAAEALKKIEQGK